MERPARREFFHELDILISRSLGMEQEEFDKIYGLDLEGFDSVDLLDSVASVESRFDIDFTKEELARIACKEDLYNQIYRKHVLEREPLDLTLLQDAAAVIPVFNHAAGLTPVIEQTLKLGIPIFVVDDGSTDGSAEVAEGFEGVTVLRHAENRGKGVALRTGMEAANGVARWALTIDADGQHEPLEAVRLMAEIPPEERPVMIGRREGMDGPTVPWTSTFGRKFSNFWVWISGGTWLPDTQSGFRVYPLPEVLELGGSASRFQYEVEILALAGWHRIPVRSVPVSVSYRPGALRVSHFRPFVDFLRNAAIFTRLITTRILIPRPWRTRKKRTP